MNQQRWVQLKNVTSRVSTYEITYFLCGFRKEAKNVLDRLRELIREVVFCQRIFDKFSALV